MVGESLSINHVKADLWAYPYIQLQLGLIGFRRKTMDEKGLLELWNTKRSQIIKAQMAPNLMLIGIFVLAAFGKFEMATDGAKYLTIGVAAATGILAIITQYATIREAEVLLTDLKRLDKPSELSKKIADSRHLLSLSAIAIVGLGIAVFALVVWAVLG